MSRYNSSEQSEVYWGTRAGFILAALGAAAGIGNIWRFAYIAGENGGGVFFFIYLICIAIIGLPILMAELVIGRAIRPDAAGSADGAKRIRQWNLFGPLAVLTAFVILSYYSAIAGWALKYLIGAGTGALWDRAAAGYGLFFASFVGSTWEPLAWQALMLGFTVWIVSAGIRNGIERANRVLMPGLLIIVIALAAFGLTLPGARQGLAFMFAPDWQVLADPNVYIAAMGQGFFSLGVGMAIYVTYGRYIRPSYGIAGSAGIVVIGDSLIAALAGVAIFTAVFTFGLNPAEGPELAFITLPQIFLVMPGGHIVAVAFFALLVAGALTSMVSILEVPVAFLEQRSRWPRRRIALSVAAASLLIGIPSTLGFGVLSDIVWRGRGIMDNLDYAVSNMLLPAGGILIAVYVGWLWKASDARAAAFANNHLIARLWHALLKYVAPALTAIIIVRALLTG